MRQPEGKSLSRNILIYSLMFIITAAGCYLFFLISGKTFIKYGDNVDGLTQIVPAYTAIKHMIGDLLAGKGLPAWSWSLGLGGDTFEYYGCKLFNPLTYLIIAFPERLIDVGYTIACVLRQYLAGLTFLLCMRENNLKSVQMISGAISYAFCGWIIGTALNQGSFENAAIIFPLLIMGTEKFFKKKSPVLFIISVALCVASGVTWTYICGIMTVVYFLARYHDYADGGVAGFFKSLGEYVLYGIVGILISAPFILSILCSMLGATTDTAAKSNPLLYSIDKYLSVPEGLFKLSEVGPVSYSFIYISVLCVCLLPLVIGAMRRKSTVAWIAVCMSVLAIFPFTSSMFNGFSYAAGRWYFILAFFLIWATMECLNEELLSQPHNLCIMSIWIVLLAAIVTGLYAAGIGSKSGAVAAVFGAVFGVILIRIAYSYYVNKNNRNILVYAAAAVLMLSIMCPANIKICPLVSDYLDEHLKAGEAWSRLNTSSERIVPDIEDDSFYRVDQGYRLNKNMKTKLKANANLVYNNNSVYIYSSLVDSKWNEFNHVLGNNYGYFARTAVMSNDNRAPIDYLLGVKYFLGDNKYEPNASDYAAYAYEPSQVIDGVEVLKSAHSIGLGTAFSKYITESELMTYPQLVRDQVMLQAVVVPDETAGRLSGLQHAQASDIETDSNELEVNLSAGKNAELDESAGTIAVKNGKGYIKIDGVSAENCQLMVSLVGLTRDAKNYRDGIIYGGKDAPEVAKTAVAEKVAAQSYKDRGDFTVTAYYGDIVKYSYCEKDSSRGFNDITEYNINLGYAEHHDGEISIKLSDTGLYHYDAIKVYAVPMDVLDRTAEGLEASSLKVAGYDGNSVFGTVNADEDSVLFLSIPYDRGWTATVDGEEVATISNVDIGFTGIKITGGEHQVELRYSHWGMKVALMGTLIGIAGLLNVIIRRRKNGHNRQTQEEG